MCMIIITTVYNYFFVFFVSFHEYEHDSHSLNPHTHSLSHYFLTIFIFLLAALAHWGANCWKTSRKKKKSLLVLKKERERTVEEEQVVGRSAEDFVDMFSVLVKLFVVHLVFSWRKKWEREREKKAARKDLEERKRDREKWDYGFQRMILGKKRGKGGRKERWGIGELTQVLCYWYGCTFLCEVQEIEWNIRLGAWNPWSYEEQFLFLVADENFKERIFLAGTVKLVFCEVRWSIEEEEDLEKVEKQLEFCREKWIEEEGRRRFGREEKRATWVVHSLCESFWWAWWRSNKCSIAQVVSEILLSRLGLSFNSGAGGLVLLVPSVSNDCSSDSTV